MGVDDDDDDDPPVEERGSPAPVAPVPVLGLELGGVRADQSLCVSKAA